MIKLSDKSALSGDLYRSEEEILLTDLGGVTSPRRERPMKDIVADMRNYLSYRYPNPERRYRHVQNVFGLYDLIGSEMLSAETFEQALADMGIVLTPVDLRAFCVAMMSLNKDKKERNKISWKKFAKVVHADKPSPSR
jgi:hypothetical protein